MQRWTVELIEKQLEWLCKLWMKYSDELPYFLANYKLSELQKKLVEIEIDCYFLSVFKRFPKSKVARDYIFFVKERDGWKTIPTETGEYILIVRNKKLIK